MYFPLAMPSSIIVSSLLTLFNFLTFSLVYRIYFTKRTLWTSFYPQGIAFSYQKLKYLTSKLQRPFDSIGFVQKALWSRCTPTFAMVNGNFASEDHRYAAVKSILKANLQEHTLKLRRVNADLSILRTALVSKHGTGPFKLIHRLVSKSIRQERFDSLCTKNKKLSKLLKSKHEPKQFSVPIINLSGQVIADATLHYLRYGQESARET